ncbi:MAG: PKD domain-containing protein [Gemmatimonadota bacterium]|nr:PKD domain-containing protein [Gemmatimonadota bacterium]
MRRVILSMGFLCGLAFSLLQAQTVITLKDVSVIPGDTAQIDLTLDNSEEVAGLQFTLTPSPAADVSFLEVSAVSRAEGWTVSANIEGDSLKVILYSEGAMLFAPGSDVILSFKYEMAPDAAIGDIEMLISGMIVSDISINPMADVTANSGTLTVAQNQPPVASFSLKPQSGLLPLTVNFNAAGSNDPDGPIVLYEWDFGDGSTAQGVTAEYTYENAGAYTVSLTVTDKKGLTAKTTGTVNVTAPPPPNPVASFTYLPMSGATPLTVNFNAEDSYDPEGVSIISYLWDFGDGSTASGQAAEHTFENAASYTVTLTVRNSEGRTGSISRTVFVYDEGDYARSDVNRDGKTDIFDLLELLGILDGSIPE